MINEGKFPVEVKQAESDFYGKKLEMLILSYSNSIVILISQFGKFGQLLESTFDYTQAQLPMENSIISSSTNFLLGYSADDRSNMIELYTGQLMDFIKRQNNREGRRLILGLGLGPEFFEFDKGNEVLEVFYKMAGECRVW